MAQTERSRPASEQRKLFYGWRMVAVAFVVDFIAVGFFFYSYGIFLKGISADLAGSRFAASLGISIANGIGATRDKDNELIEKTTEGDMKRNTVEQIRSRTLKEVRDTLTDVSRPLAIVLAVGLFALASSSAFAAGGDQTGGRKGASVSQHDVP